MVILAQIYQKMVFRQFLPYKIRLLIAESTLFFAHIHFGPLLKGKTNYTIWDFFLATVIFRNGVKTLIINATNRGPKACFIAQLFKYGHLFIFMAQKQNVSPLYISPASPCPNILFKFKSRNPSQLDFSAFHSLKTSYLILSWMLYH